LLFLLVSFGVYLLSVDKSCGLQYGLTVRLC
jgi:hypothetical protein